MIANILKTETNLKEFLEQKEKSILFVHNIKAVEQIALFRKDLNKSRCLLIPTSVEAIFILDKLKLPYRIPEDYYRPEEIYNYANGLESKIINLVKEIDQELKKAYLGVKQSGLRPAFYHLYSFVRVYFPLIDAYFKIKKIIQIEQPQKIGLFIENKVANENIPDGLEAWLLWSPNENLFQKIFNTYQINLPVHSFVLNKTSQSVKSDFFKENWRDRIGKRFFHGKPRLYYFFKIFKTDRQAALLNFYYRFRLIPLLLLNNDYDWKWCHKELRKRGYYIWGQLDDSLGNWYREDVKDLQLSENIICKLEQSSSFRKNFKEDDIDFYPLLKDKIGLFLKKVVPASLSAYRKTTQLIKKKRLKAVLFSVNPTAVSKSIAYAAQKSGLPIIGWQHGDMNYRPSYSIILNDLLTCDLFLGWGKGANENRQEVAKELKLERKQKNIGSASLDKLISLPVTDCPKILDKIGIKNIARPIIVYVTTIYYLSNTYNFSYPPWSDNYIYDTQKKIIERLALLRGTKIIKLHPNLFYALPVLDEYCQSFKKQNVWTVRNEITANSLFSIADVIIIDVPSTTLLQAIACKKPIFCLTRHLRLEDKAMEMLQKRVVLAEDPELLISEVESFFQFGKYKADLQNSEFLESYGTNSDCKAAERAAVTVDELIKNFLSKSK